MELLTPLYNFLANAGTLGAVILFLAWVIWQLVKRLDQKDAEIKALNQALNLVQEKRVADNQKNITDITSMGKDFVNTQSSIQTAVNMIANLIQFKKKL